MEKTPDPAQGKTATSHPYTSLPQSKKRKKLPYTWLTFLFLVVLAIIAAVIVNIVPLKTVTHRIPHLQKTSQSGY